MRLDIKAAAGRDLVDIRDFGAAQFGRDVATAYLRDLRAAFERIQTYPAVGEQSPNLTPPIHVLACRNHRIYYRIEQDRGTIVRILHRARNARNLL